MILLDRFLPGYQYFIALLFIPFLYSISTERDNRAAEWHSNGLHFANKGDYRQALAYFRGACRANNQSSVFWNDLGVTEMRQGDLNRAIRRFRKSLKLDPSFSLAKHNYEDLIKYFKNKDPKYFEVTEDVIASRSQLHKILFPVTITKNEFLQLTKNELKSLMQEPFIVKYYVKSYKSRDKFSLLNLRRLFGDYYTDYYPHNMLEEQAHPFFRLLRDAIDQLTDPKEIFLDVDASHPGTYLQLNLNTTAFEKIVHAGNISFPLPFNDEVWTSDCFSNNVDKEKTLEESLLSEFYLKTHWKMLLIGEENAGMFMHQDTLKAATYQIQMIGAKRWHLCSGDQSKFLYSAGSVDMFRPDYDSYPLVKNAECYDMVASKGDLVYYPGDYWHQTLNLITPSVAISGTLVTEEDYQDLINELKKECNGSKRIFEANDRLCNALNRCYSKWSSMFQNKIEL